MMFAADCAYPTDWHDLDPRVQVVLGYVGSPTGTPHVWTDAEVASVHKAGRVWAPIWTPPQPPFDHVSGQAAAAGMSAQLRRRNYTTAGPVFLDIEEPTWAAAPATVSAGIDAWKAGMHAAGYPHAYAYVPARAQFDWVADWVTTPPEHLAPGVIGVQYAGEVQGGEYDLSVFNPAVFSGLFTADKGDPVGFSAADRDYLHTHIAAPLAALQASLTRLYADRDATNPRPFALRHLSEKLDQVLADVARPRPAAVDAKALATELAARLGPALGDEVVKALATELAK